MLHLVIAWHHKQNFMKDTLTIVIVAAVLDA